MDSGVIMQLIMAAAVGIGTYAAIRADLARLNEIATQARETADKAHTRIDGMMRRDDR